MKDISWLFIGLIFSLSSSACFVSSDQYESLENTRDSLSYELKMEQRLNNQLQAYIEEVCYPKVEPSLRRTSAGIPPVSASTAVPDSLPKLKLRPTGNPHTYQLDEVLRFNPAQVELTSNTLATVQRVADTLRLYDGLIVTVVGHCDNTEENSTDAFEDSWGLSSARANAVARVLIARGVSPQYIIVAGRGRFYPIDSNRSQAGQQRNRRVDLFVDTRSVVH